MRMRHRRLLKVCGMVAAGTMFAVGCLPKDYWYSFVANGRTSLLDAFANSVFTTITDTLFPAADGNTNSNTNSN